MVIQSISNHVVFWCPRLRLSHMCCMFTRRHVYELQIQSLSFGARCLWLISVWRCLAYVWEWKRTQGPQGLNLALDGPARTENDYTPSLATLCGCSVEVWEYHQNGCNGSLEWFLYSFMSVFQPQNPLKFVLFLSLFLCYLFIDFWLDFATSGTSKSWFSHWRYCKNRLFVESFLKNFGIAFYCFFDALRSVFLTF